MRRMKMATKKTVYITAELDFAEEQLATWKKYIQENPYNEVEDRKELMKSKTGGSYYTVVQNKEAIQKSLRDTMKEYLALLAEVERLREKEESKTKEVRGGGDIPYRMRNGSNS